MTENLTDRSIALILAGGVGSRLHPLTADRAKPAVPFGGKYRIIDFTLSNCLHSGLRRMLVLTQYKSHSLQKHLRDGWSIFNPGLGEYITTIPPQMRTGESWYLGTADAVYQNLYLVERSGAEYVVVLSGDHIYRMDYAAMLAHHCAAASEVTVACMRVPVERASAFGVLSIDGKSRMTEFHEKPEHPERLPEDPTHALASMGVYVFSTAVLSSFLRNDHARDGSSHDFGRDLLPLLVQTGKVSAYEFGGHTGRVSVDRYWRDVGTIDAYFEANLDLLEPVPAIDLYQENWPIRTFELQSPPARTAPGHSGQEAQVIRSIVCSGTIVAGGTVRQSILSPRVRVGDLAVVERSILFDSVRVGAGARLRNCIVEKGVDIPPGEEIGADAGGESTANSPFPVSDGGITVVPKGYRFADGPSSKASRLDSKRDAETYLDGALCPPTRIRRLVGLDGLSRASSLRASPKKKPEASAIRGTEPA